MRLLETAESQLALLLEATPDADIEGFEAELHDLLKADDTYRRLLEGWTVGSQADLAKVLAGEAAHNPEEKQLLLDKRNRNWLPQIESMMVSKQTLFVTVGAAHLVGPGSVLDMPVRPRLEGAADQDGAVLAAAGLPRSRIDDRSAPLKPGRSAALERAAIASDARSRI